MVICEPFPEFMFLVLQLLSKVCSIPTELHPHLLPTSKMAQINQLYVLINKLAGHVNSSVWSFNNMALGH